LSFLLYTVMQLIYDKCLLNNDTLFIIGYQRGIFSLPSRPILENAPVSIRFEVDAVAVNG